MRYLFETLNTLVVVKIIENIESAQKSRRGNTVPLEFYGITKDSPKSDTSEDPDLLVFVCISINALHCVWHKVRT